MRKAAVVAAALAVIAGACGSGEQQTPRANEPASGTAAHLHLIGNPSPDDVAVQLAIESGFCVGQARPELGKVDVVETADAVTVTARLIVSESHSGACADVGYRVPVPVALRSPLGTRRILDGSCTPPADVLREGEARQACTPTQQQEAQQDAVGAWKEFDAGPLSPRGEPKGAWDGKELIVVGGLALEQYRVLSDGAAYNPTTQKWRAIPDLPTPGRVHAVAPTGDGLLALSHPGNELSVFEATAAHVYSAATNAWSEVPPPLAISYPHAMWTGKEDIVWGANGGAIFNPATNAWRQIPALGIAGAATSGLASGGVSAWIGDPGVLAVQGDYDAHDGSQPHSALFLFNPSTNKWRKAADPPGNLRGFGSFAVGSTEVFDGYEEANQSPLAYNAKADKWRKLDAIAGHRDGGTAYFTGVDLGDGRAAVRIADDNRPLSLLEVAGGHWSHAASPGRIPAPDAVTVWIGDRVLLWGRPANIRPDDRNAAWTWTPPAK